MTAEPTATPQPDDPGTSGTRGVPRIEDAYLDRAIREVHLLEERMDACPGCANAGTFPVKASGSPTADVMLIKWQSALAERQEGVSFFGRSGDAIRRSVERLGVDPSVLYGTLVLKCPHAAGTEPGDEDLEWLAEEIRIVRPRLIVVMGDRGPQPLRHWLCPTSTIRWTSRTPSASSGPTSVPWATGTQPNPRTDRSGVRAGPTYESARVKRATASMCGVWGNMSTGRTHSNW